MTEEAPQYWLWDMVAPSLEELEDMTKGDPDTWE